MCVRSSASRLRLAPRACAAVLLFEIFSGCTAGDSEPIVSAQDEISGNAGSGGTSGLAGSGGSAADLDRGPSCGIDTWLQPDSRLEENMFEEIRSAIDSMDFCLTTPLQREMPATLHCQARLALFMAIGQYEQQQGSGRGSVPAPPDRGPASARGSFIFPPDESGAIWLKQRAPTVRDAHRALLDNSQDICNPEHLHAYTSVGVANSDDWWLVLFAP
jgi:hypothetical protein